MKKLSYNVKLFKNIINALIGRYLKNVQEPKKKMDIFKLSIL